MRETYFFRIGDTQYNLLDVTHNELSHQAYQYMKSLSLEDRVMLALNHDDKSTIAIIVGDRIRYPFSTKLGPFEYMVVEKHTETQITDEMAVQHVIHYLEGKYNK